MRLLPKKPLRLSNCTALIQNLSFSYHIFPSLPYIRTVARIVSCKKRSKHTHFKHIALIRDLIAPATFFPLTNFLRHSVSFVFDSPKKYRKYLNSDKCSNRILFIIILHYNLSSKPNFITFRFSSNSPNKNKSSTKTRSGNLHSSRSHSHPPHPHFNLHHCVHIYIEKQRVYDTTLSHTTIVPETLTLTPFNPINIHTLYSIQKFTTHIIPSTCYNTSLLTLSYAFSKFITSTYTLHFFSRNASIFLTFSYRSLTLVQWSNHSGPPVFSDTTTLENHIT